MNVFTFRWKIAQFFERIWWRNYLGNKNIDDYLQWKYNYWKDFYSKIEDVVTITSRSTILDAGCGPSGIFMLFEENEIDAIDPLLNQYEKDLPHFKRSLYPNVKFQTIAIEDYHSTNNFDCIFCINAINHVKDIDQSIANLTNHLKSKGRLVISIDAHNHAFLKTIFKLFPGDILHPHQYDLNEYTEMVTKSGCRILKTMLLKKAFVFDYYVIVAERL